MRREDLDERAKRLKVRYLHGGSSRRYDGHKPESERALLERNSSFNDPFEIDEG
jgi:hypothetical protein